MAKKSVKKNTKHMERRPVKTEVNIEKRPQTFRGRVVSVKLPQAVTVLVESKKTHPLYGKSYKRSRKFLAAVDQELVLGDLVEIVQCAPISKRKRFKVTKVLGRDIEAVVTEQLKEEAAEAIAEVLPEEKDGEEGQEVSIKSEEEVKMEEPKKKSRAKKGEKAS